MKHKSFLVVPMIPCQLLLQKFSTRPVFFKARRDFIVNESVFLFTVLTLYHCLTDCTYFVKRCPENRLFTKKELSVQPLEVTQQVLVEDIQNINEDHLHLYFDRPGWDLDDVELIEAEQSAIITFKDHKGTSATLHIFIYEVNILVM